MVDKSQEYPRDVSTLASEVTTVQLRYIDQARNTETQMAYRAALNVREGRAHPTLIHSTQTQINPTHTVVGARH